MATYVQPATQTGTVSATNTGTYDWQNSPAAIRYRQLLAARAAGSGAYTPRTPAAPTGAPQDPILSAFLRQMGVLEQSVLAQSRQQRALEDVRLGTRFAGLDDEEADAVQGIHNDAETRGIHGSGASLQDVGLLRANFVRQRNLARFEAQDRLAGIDLNQSQKLVDFRAKAIEAELEARLRQAENAARASYGGR